MALEILFKKLDTNDLASAQPGSFAAKPKAPQPVNEGDATTAQSALASAAIPTYNTHVKIFQFSTGDDPGTHSELEGYIEFPNSRTNSKRRAALELQNERFFSSENGGFGRLAADTSIDTVFTPANFKVLWYEHDDTSPNDIIINKYMDWSDIDNKKFMKGAWSQEWWNRDDIAYKVLHLADGSDYVCEKLLLFLLSNEGLWVSLIDEETDDDLG